MNQHASLFANSLVEESRSSPVLSDIFESIQLISGNVTALFINKSLISLTSKATQTQDFYTRVKKQIIYKSQSLDGNKVINVLKTLSSEQIATIGKDFLYVTASKFAKSQPIEKYTQFLFYMFRSFGVDEEFLKFFLRADRDPTEVKFFLDYISRWQLDNLAQILDQISSYCLEEFILLGSIENFFDLFNLIFEFLLKDNLQEKLLTSFSSFLKYIFQNDFSTKVLEKAFNIFRSKGLKIDLSTTNKILELINSNNKNEDMLKIALNIFKENNITFDLVSYNMIMNIYTRCDNFNEAKKIFDKLPEINLEADFVTYSILIKSLKNCSENKIENAMNLFRKYKRTQNTKDISVYNALLFLLVSENDKEKIDRIFEDLVKEGLQPDSITFNTIIKGSFKNQDLDYSFQYFKKMNQYGLSPNRITYNSLIDLAIKVGQIHIALELIEQMLDSQISPDSQTFSIILTGLKTINSSQILVKKCLLNIKKVLMINESASDQNLFNTILDITAKYQLVDLAEDFYALMKNKGFKETPQTCTLLISVYTQSSHFDQAIELFKRMLQSGMKIKESSYGLILDCCTRNDKMNLVIDIYSSMKEHYFNMNSIVFTTIIKGFIKSRKYKEALTFFSSIKHYTNLPGMIITYNCALDIYANMQDYQGAISLFEEISTSFEPDLISYSTLIKALCVGNKKSIALDYLKKMVQTKILIDISVINLFLDSCSTKEDFKLAIDGYKFAMMSNIEPNEITFGIMVKVYGFARELQNAFDLLDLMNVYNIQPSIIIFTNLIHISFYCREPRKAELAFLLFKKTKVNGDSLIYSKIIDGLLRFKQLNKVPKYIKYCLDEKCPLNPKTVKQIMKHFTSDEMKETLEKIQGFKEQEKIPQKSSQQFTNTFNVENPKRFKKQIREQRIQVLNTNVMKPQNTETKEIKPTSYQGYANTKKPVALHNFRRNKI